MRRILIVAFIVALLAAGFYVAWPAWTARQISNAVKANDAAALAEHIDFPRVRERAHPIMTAEMNRRLDQLKQQGGALGGAIAGQLKESLGGSFAKATVDALLTPENVMSMIRQGRDFRRVMSGAATKQPAPVGGGSTGKPGQTGDATSNAHRRFSLANVRGYMLTGPLSVAVDLARDKSAPDADLVVEMAFTGGNWKVVGIIPKVVAGSGAGS